MSPPRPESRHAAFTLVELLTVAALVALLAGIAVGALRGGKGRAAQARARSELAALTNALEEFKRHYGDYPQLGDFASIGNLTPANTTGGPGTGTSQAKLFNCLTGVFGPRGFTAADRVNGPSLLDVGRFVVNPAQLAATFQVPVVPGAGQAPVKTEQNAGLLDPWGRYYVYYYKSARAPGNWQAPAYVLYSAGPPLPPPLATTTPAPIATNTGLPVAVSANTAGYLFATPL
ncbi:MAG: hypothetical protein RLZZ15_3209 [Verrucomicrobiota bacterium]|jgi:prepilin-type N-terminal cleavage/methylation domain-containing protein